MVGIVTKYDCRNFVINEYDDGDGSDGSDSGGYAGTNFTVDDMSPYIGYINVNHMPKEITSLYY